MSPFLHVERDGPVMRLTMDDPAARNALSGNGAVADFVEACARINADETVRAVVLTGAGPAFSAGGNLDAMRADWRDRSEGASVRGRLRGGVQQLSLALFGLEVPVVAAINGPAIGGGLDVACLCDIRIASPAAKFAANFTKLGLVPALGGAWLLPRIVGATRAARLCLTGETLDAEAALACGLVGEIVAPDALLARATELAQAVARQPAQALRMTKALLRASGTQGFSEHLETAAAMQALALHTREHESRVGALRAPAPAP